ncbi:hypothetical protein [Microbacterium marinilacus]|uniref:AbiEi antitoxin C-terminal domain-containing protein n=1 Tax=Microbacterium marinilacus TaxID=415209 RepID=A0ABP7B7Y4_9MICO|nr:hypothetical protein [Microbacterium marinilacus]MBY0687484.1 hypothetical protein [Microbacterium marinilacus]
MRESWSMFLLARRSGHAFGLLVVDEARRSGWLPRLDRAISRGAATEVRPGVYMSARRWRALPGADRTLARIYAAALTHPDAVFAFHSAAALYRLPLPEADLEDVHVLEADPGAQGFVAHPESAHSEVVERFGLNTTSPVQTVLDMANALDYDDALELVRAATREPDDLRFTAPPLCTKIELLDAAEALAERTGDGRTVELARAADPEHLSNAA